MTEFAMIVVVEMARAIFLEFEGSTCQVSFLTL